MPASKPVVAMLVYDGMGPFHLSGPFLVFGNNGLNEPPVELLMFAADSRPLRTTVNLSILAPQGLEVLERAQAIILPGWYSADTPVPYTLLKALRQAAAAGVYIMATGMGVFVLAASGLLNGRRATTHWLLAPQFAQRFPQVQLDADFLYICEHNLLTCAGGVAAVDAGLVLLQKLLSAEQAERISRWVLSAALRSGAQNQILEKPMSSSDRYQRLLLLIDHMRSCPGDTYRLDTLAQSVHMTTRSFSRHFRKITGTSLVQWLLSQRLNHALRLLENTHDSVETIAMLSGFNNAAYLRKQFHVVHGMSPTAYRKQFRNRQSGRKAPL